MGILVVHDDGLEVLHHPTHAPDVDGNGLSPFLYEGILRAKGALYEPIAINRQQMEVHLVRIEHVGQDVHDALIYRGGVGRPGG